MVANCDHLVRIKFSPSRPYAFTEHGAIMAANVLNNLDVDLRKVRCEIEKIVQYGPGGEQVLMGRLPHTASLRQSMCQAS